MNDNYDIKSAFVRKRNNNYNVYIEYLDNDTGKIKQKSIAKYGLKKKAERHLIDIKAAINNKQYIISKDVTVVDRCYRYINDNIENWSPHTVNNRTSWIKLNIAPFFTDVKMTDLTVYQVQKFINYLFENFTPESAKVRFGFLGAVIKESYRMKEINENLCDFVKFPNKQSEDITEVYSREETLELFNAIKNTDIELPIMLISLLGLRKSEMYALTWDDIDFKNSAIRINKISLYVDKKLIFKKPKTKGSERILSAPEELMKLLKTEKIKQAELKLKDELDNIHNLVCLNRYLEPYKNNDINRYYRKFCKENNFKEIRIHDLRHTNATLLLLAGTDMKTISCRLGHTDIKITMNKYSHVLEEMDKKASDNLSNMLFNEKSTGN